MISPLANVLKAHDQSPMPAETLAAFKELCAYQLDHNPELTLHPAFRRIIAVENLTYGAAATIAPFMVQRQ